MISKMPTKGNDITLSVIVASHNGQGYLSDALLSLKNAIATSPQSIEIIIINDSSTDDTPRIMSSFAQAIPHTKFYNVEFRNIGKVRNFGVKKASGKYVTMLDDDDQLLPNSLNQISSFLERHQPDILLTKLNEIRADMEAPTTWEIPAPEKMSQHELISHYLIHKKIQAHCIGQFIKRKILLDNNFPDYICYEDAYIFPSIIKKSHDILHINNGHYLYFKRDKSISNSIDIHKIKLLIESVKEMEIQFGEKYRNLIACHWLEIYRKHKGIICNEAFFDDVTSKISDIKLMSFLCDFKVRLSFKRKLLRLKLRNNR